MIEQEESKKSEASWKVPDGTIESMVEELRMEDYQMQIHQEQVRCRTAAAKQVRRKSLATMQRAATAPPCRRSVSTPLPHMNTVLSRPSTRGPPNRPAYRDRTNNASAGGARHQKRPQNMSAARPQNMSRPHSRGHREPRGRHAQGFKRR